MASFVCTICSLSESKAKYNLTHHMQNVSLRYKNIIDVF